MDAPPAIEAVGLTKAFGRTVAVHDVSFAVARGELFVVMGLSGSGKSTLVRMLNRLIEPTAGALAVDGRDVLAMGDAELRTLRNRTLSMVFQHFALLPHRSVLENAAYGLRVRGEDVRARNERARRALHEVGLGDWEDARPAELSGGMQQRVGLARALATDTDVLLMDEPFSALDPLIRRDMQELLVRLRRKLGKTIVFVTHDLNEAMRLGDRILLLRDGSIVQLGTRAEILSAPADDYVADFVSDVDRTRVLRAGDAACRPRAVATLGERSAAVLDRLEREGLSALYVLDADGRLAGVADRAALAGARGEAGEAGTLTPAHLSDDYRVVAPERALPELAPLVGGRAVPLAVRDGDGRLLGVVPQRRLLEAITGSRGGAAHA